MSNTRDTRESTLVRASESYAINGDFILECSRVLTTDSVLESLIRLIQPIYLLLRVPLSCLIDSVGGGLQKYTDGAFGGKEVTDVLFPGL